MSEMEAKELAEELRTKYREHHISAVPTISGWTWMIEIV